MFLLEVGEVDSGSGDVVLELLDVCKGSRELIRIPSDFTLQPLDVGGEGSNGAILGFVRQSFLVQLIACTFEFGSIGGDIVLEVLDLCKDSQKHILADPIRSPAPLSAWPRPPTARS